MQTSILKKKKKKKTLVMSIAKTNQNNIIHSKIKVDQEILHFSLKIFRPKNQCQYDTFALMI